MASLLNLEGLSNQLNAAVTNPVSNPNATTNINGQAVSDPLAESVGGAIQTWLQASIFPLIMGTVIFATVLAVFYGGFLYFTAYGDENKATTAKKSITYGFIGLAIALLAFTITSYVRQNLLTKQAEQEINEEYTAPVTNEDDSTYTNKAQELFE